MITYFSNIIITILLFLLTNFFIIWYNETATVFCIGFFSILLFGLIKQGRLLPRTRSDVRSLLKWAGDLMNLGGLGRGVLIIGAVSGDGLWWVILGCAVVIVIFRVIGRVGNYIWLIFCFSIFSEFYLIFR